MQRDEYGREFPPSAAPASGSQYSVPQGYFYPLTNSHFVLTHPGNYNLDDQQFSACPIGTQIGVSGDSRPPSHYQPYTNVPTQQGGLNGYPNGFVNQDSCPPDFYQQYSSGPPQQDGFNGYPNGYHNGYINQDSCAPDYYQPYNAVNPGDQYQPWMSQQCMVVAPTSQGHGSMPVYGGPPTQQHHPTDPLQYPTGTYIPTGYQEYQQSSADYYPNYYCYVNPPPPVSPPPIQQSYPVPPPDNGAPYGPSFPYSDVPSYDYLKNPSAQYPLVSSSQPLVSQSYGYNLPCSNPQGFYGAGWDQPCYENDASVSITSWEQQGQHQRRDMRRDMRGDMHASPSDLVATQTPEAGPTTMTPQNVARIEKGVDRHTTTNDQSSKETKIAQQQPSHTTTLPPREPVVIEHVPEHVPKSDHGDEHDVDASAVERTSGDCYESALLPTQLMDDDVHDNNKVVIAAVPRKRTDKQRNTVLQHDDGLKIRSAKERVVGTTTQLNNNSGLLLRTQALVNRKSRAEQKQQQQKHLQRAISGKQQYGNCTIEPYWSGNPAVELIEGSIFYYIAEETARRLKALQEKCNEVPNQSTNLVGEETTKRGEETTKREEETTINPKAENLTILSSIDVIIPTIDIPTVNVPSANVLSVNVPNKKLPSGPVSCSPSLSPSTLLPSLDVPIGTNGSTIADAVTLIIPNVPSNLPPAEVVAFVTCHSSNRRPLNLVKVLHGASPDSYPCLLFCKADSVFDLYTQLEGRPYNPLESMECSVYCVRGLTASVSANRPLSNGPPTNKSSRKTEERKQHQQSRRKHLQSGVQNRHDSHACADLEKSEEVLLFQRSRTKSESECRNTNSNSRQMNRRRVYTSHHDQHDQHDHHEKHDHQDYHDQHSRHEHHDHHTHHEKHDQHDHHDHHEKHDYHDQHVHHDHHEKHDHDQHDQPFQHVHHDHHEKYGHDQHDEHDHHEKHDPHVQHDQHDHHEKHDHQRLKSLTSQETDISTSVSNDMPAQQQLNKVVLPDSASKRDQLSLTRSASNTPSSSTSSDRKARLFRFECRYNNGMFSHDGLTSEGTSELESENNGTSIHLRQSYRCYSDPGVFSYESSEGHRGSLGLDVGSPTSLSGIMETQSMEEKREIGPAAATCNMDHDDVTRDQRSVDFRHSLTSSWNLRDWDIGWGTGNSRERKRAFSMVSQRCTAQPKTTERSQSTSIKRVESHMVLTETIVSDTQVEGGNHRSASRISNQSVEDRVKSHDIDDSGSHLLCHNNNNNNKNNNNNNINNNKSMDVNQQLESQLMSPSFLVRRYELPEFCAVCLEKISDWQSTAITAKQSPPARQTSVQNRPPFSETASACWTTTVSVSETTPGAALGTASGTLSYPSLVPAVTTADSLSSTKPSSIEDPALVDLGVPINILCGHSFHSHCLLRWGDVTCPVCRHSQYPGRTSSCCDLCGTTERIWMCLVCGFLGCARETSNRNEDDNKSHSNEALDVDNGKPSSKSLHTYQQYQNCSNLVQQPSTTTLSSETISGHSYQHFVDTQHIYALELSTQRVWDFLRHSHVYRLLQNREDGKVVESGYPGKSSDGIDINDNDDSEYEPQNWSKTGIEGNDKNSYGVILTAFHDVLQKQLVDQCNYFEAQQLSMVKGFEEIEKQSGDRNTGLQRRRDQAEETWKRLTEKHEEEIASEKKLHEEVKKTEGQLQKLEVLRQRLVQQKEQQEKQQETTMSKLKDEEKEKLDVISNLESQISDYKFHLKATRELGTSLEPSSFIVGTRPTRVSGRRGRGGARHHNNR